MTRRSSRACRRSCRCRAGACALTITLTRSSSPFAMAVISGPLKFAHRLTSTYASGWPAGPGKTGAGADCEPPWCRSTTNALMSCSAFSSVTSALTVATSGRKSARRPGRRCHDRRRPSKRQPDGDLLAIDRLHLVRRQDGPGRCRRGRRSQRGTGRTHLERRAVLAAVDRMAAAVLHAQQLVNCLRRTRGCRPRSSMPIEFSASIVGSSWKSAETSGSPPIRSPAPTMSVLELAVRSDLMCVAR